MNFEELHANKTLFKVRGETIEKTFLLPAQLKKFIRTDIFMKTKPGGLDPVIEYLGASKHQKIKDKEYHNSKGWKRSHQVQPINHSPSPLNN